MSRTGTLNVSYFRQNKPNSRRFSRTRHTGRHKCSGLHEVNHDVIMTSIFQVTGYFRQPALAPWRTWRSIQRTCLPRQTLAFASVTQDDVTLAIPTERVDRGAPRAATVRWDLHVTAQKYFFYGLGSARPGWRAVGPTDFRVVGCGPLVL